MANQGTGEAISSGDGLFDYSRSFPKPIIIIEAPPNTTAQCFVDDQPLPKQTGICIIGASPSPCSHGSGIQNHPTAQLEQTPDTNDGRSQYKGVVGDPPVEERNLSSPGTGTASIAACSDDDCLFCHPPKAEAEAGKIPGTSLGNLQFGGSGPNPQVAQREQVSTTVEAEPPTSTDYRCSLHNPEPAEPEQAPSITEEKAPVYTDSVPNTLVDNSKAPNASKEAPHIKFSPKLNDKVVFEMNGTRIFRTTSSSSTLYQLSHPITWNTEEHEREDSLTLTAMTQLPYIPPRLGSRRVCDIQFLGPAYDKGDTYPQALIRSPSWGLKPSLMRFYYESQGRVIGVSSDESGSNGRHKPSLIMAGGVVERDETHRVMEKPKLDYPKGVYKIQWMDVETDKNIAIELCDMVQQGDAGRLTRRYRLSFNSNKVPQKEAVDLLVAIWVTRIWMEEVFMRLIKRSHRQFVKEQAKKKSRLSEFDPPLHLTESEVDVANWFLVERRRVRGKLRRGVRRCVCRPARGYYDDYRH